MDNVFLIVGLGNPGAKYVRTRHNAGFMAVERLAVRLGAIWKLETDFQSRLSSADCGGRRAVLCQPQTYMNSSGEAVRRVAEYYRIPVERILVIVDDADLLFGRIRLRAEGSSGGHHGLESVEQHLATRAYPRLRIGIGRESPVQRELTDRVLGRFGADEMEKLNRVLDRSADQVQCWMGEGIERAMNLYNGVVDDPESREN